MEYRVGCETPNLKPENKARKATWLRYISMIMNLIPTLEDKAGCDDLKRLIECCADVVIDEVAQQLKCRGEK